MPYEDDIRAAFRCLADEAPDASSVLTAVLECEARASSRQPPRQAAPRSGRRLLVPLAAATAVVAVIVAAVAVGAGRHPAPGSGPGPRTVPRYYLQLSQRGRVLYPLDAVIRDAVTGKTLVTLSAPRQFGGFTEVTAAGDDRTFVLVAQRERYGLGGGPIKLFLVRFDPARRTAKLTALPIPVLPPASGEDGLGGLALSPSGSQLAVAVEGKTAGRPTSKTQIRVYSVATGAVRVWKQTARGNAFPFENTLSWTRSGMLAVNWYNAPHPGVWLLDTRTKGGGLLANSRFVRSINNGDWTFYGGGAIVSMDGRLIVAPMYRGSDSRTEIQEFSTVTGKRIRVLWHRSSRPGLAQGLVWSNATGSVLVALALRNRTGRSAAGLAYGALTANQFTPIPESVAPTTPTALAQSIAF
jgi:hypothetical protein